MANKIIQDISLIIILRKIFSASEIQDQQLIREIRSTLICILVYCGLFSRKPWRDH